MNSLQRLTDEVAARLRHRLKARVGITGHLRVERMDGEVLFDHHNTVVYAGIGALVDALQAQAYVNTYKYVGFGTGNTGTQATDTQLGTEVTGGTYARLTATQGEGDNAREYRLSGTWTNSSGSTQAVTEYGIFSAATEGTMLARACQADGDVATKTVANGETIAVTWDLQFADA
jgi:hypothetical protein